MENNTDPNQTIPPINSNPTPPTQLQPLPTPTPSVPPPQSNPPQPTTPLSQPPPSEISQQSDFQPQPAPLAQSPQPTQWHAKDSGVQAQINPYESAVQSDQENLKQPEKKATIKSLIGYFLLGLVFNLLGLIVGSILIIKKSKNEKRKRFISLFSGLVISTVLMVIMNQFVYSYMGKKCEVSLNSKEVSITYYENNNQYLLVNTYQQKSKTVEQKSHNILFTGTHYHMWNSPPNQIMADGSSTSGSVYTIEEANSLSLNDSFQLREVKKHPELCKAWVVDPNKFIPPSDVRFMTVKEMTEIITNNLERNNELLIDALNMVEEAKKTCEVCKAQYSSQNEQSECFNNSSTLTEYDTKMRNDLYKEYCVSIIE